MFSESNCTWVIKPYQCGTESFAFIDVIFILSQALYDIYICICPSSAVKLLLYESI